jgi:hypothetical protein
MGYTNNNKNGIGGWVVIEDSGHILVKNIFRSNPIGDIYSLQKCTINKKTVSFVNSLNEHICVNFPNDDDAANFHKVIVHNMKIKKKLTNPADERHSNIELIVKLGELRDAGILTDDEYQKKKTEVLKRI